jgi:hypothetical protein
VASLRKAKYAASSNLTITLASLATSTNAGNPVAGRESSVVNNDSSTNYLDYLLSGFVTTGTSPVAGRIEVWVIPQTDDSTWKQAAGAGDAAITYTTADIKAASGKLAQSIPTDTTNDRTYPFAADSVAALFGGVCPSRFVVVVLHNTNVNLNATAGNHQITVKGTYEDLNG